MGFGGGQFPGFVRFLTSPVDETAHQNEAAETSMKFSPVDKASLPKEAANGLDELPFKIKDGGPEEGYLTLIRNFQDEIIEINVRPKKRIRAFGVEAENEDLESLYLLVKIYHGDEFKKCLEFLVVAYPDNIHIRKMCMRAENGTKHLQAFEEFFKQRVIQQSNFKIDLSNNLKFLSDCVFRRKKTNT